MMTNQFSGWFDGCEVVFGKLRQWASLCKVSDERNRMLLSLVCLLVQFSCSAIDLNLTSPSVGGQIQATSFVPTTTEDINVDVPTGYRADLYFTVKSAEKNDLSVPDGIQLYAGSSLLGEDYARSSSDKVTDFPMATQKFVYTATSSFKLSLRITGTAAATRVPGYDLHGRPIMIPGPPSQNMYYIVTYQFDVSYSKISTSYTVTYKPGSYGTGSQQTATKTQGSTLTLKGAIFTRTGYTQTGWSTTDGGSKVFNLNGSYTTDASVTLYPYWTANASTTYTVTYKPGVNGTGSQQTSTKTKGVTLTLRGALYTRTGCTQIGWAVIEDGAYRYGLNGNYYDDASITLYPAWEKNSYVVTYDANGGTISGSDTYTATVRYGSNYPICYTDSWWNHRFIGWFTERTGGQQVTDKTVMTTARNHTLYAHWESTAPTTYTVTYKPGAYGSGSQQTATKTKGAALTLKGAIFTRSGYRQDGWMTTQTLTDSTDLYELGGSYAKDASITLYPYWVEDHVTLSSIFISGSAVLPSGGAGSYVCTATYSDGSTKEVTPEWSIKSGSDIASIDQHGKVTIAEVSAARNITIQADYSEVYADGAVMKSWTKGVTVSASVAKPDLRPQILSGWSRPIVVSSAAGEYGDDTSFCEGDELYVSWGVGCDDQDVSSRYYTGLYVDDAMVGQWHTDALTKGYVAFIKDFNIGTLSAGNHTIRLVADMTGDVSESNEGNNVYELTIKVSGAAAPTTGANVIVESARFVPSDELSLYGTATIEITLKNVGTESAWATPVRVYAGGEVVRTRQWEVAGYWETGTVSDFVELCGAPWKNLSVDGLSPNAQESYSFEFTPSDFDDVEDGFYLSVLAGESAARLKDGHLYSISTSVVDEGLEPAIKAPKGLRVSYPDEAAIRIDWNTVDNVDVYYVCRQALPISGDAGLDNAEKIATVEDSFYVDRAVNYGQDYRYYVVAVKWKIAESSPSDPVDARVEAPTLETYTVTYKPGLNGTGLQQTATKTKGVSLTLLGAIFTCTGYTQTGWSMTDGGGKAYGLGSPYTTDAAVTLYPYWAENAQDAPTYGPWGEAEAVKNPDKLGPTMLTDMTLELNGAAGAVGDVVAAFRGDTGALCGLGKVMDESGTLSMACYAPTGVKLHFKVWVAASGIENPVVVDCDAKSDLTAPTSGAFLSGHALVVSDDKDLTISLRNADWHTVSFNVLPEDPSPAAVFGSVQSKIAAVTQGIEFWMPGKQSSLKAIEIGKGYWVNTKVDNVEWTVSGKTDPKTEIALEEGWNLVGYAPETESEVQQVLKTALAARAVDYVTYGVEFYPGGTLTKMEPGKAYWVHATKAWRLVYDEVVENSKFKVQSAAKVSGDRNVAAPLLGAAVPTYGPWGESEAVKNPDKLGPTFLTDMAVEIDGAPAAYGDVVAVFRGDTGALCGLGKVMDDSGSLTVVCYAPKGVMLNFKVWLSESGVEEAVVVKCDNASKLVAPDVGAFYAGHEISGSTAELIETIVPGEKVEIDTGYKGYTASGLPSGLKFDKTSGLITGSAAKPTAAEGVVVKFTKSGAETEELTIIVTAIPKVTVVMEGVNSPSDTDGCKVTGAGAYLVDKKVTLKATAPKGTAFVGWFDDEGVVATQTTYTFTMGKEDVALVAKFEKEVIDVNCGALVEGAMFPAGVAGAQGGIKITAEAPSGVKSVAVSKLPSGMKFDAKNGNVITGTPTKPGEYTVQVKVTSNTGAVETKDVKIVVVAMPETAVGTFNGFVSVGEDNFGTFTLTATDAGKLTAKVVTAAGTVSFSGTSWDAVEDGVYRTALTTKKGETLTLALDSTAAWDANQLSGEFISAAVAATKTAAAVPSRTYAVSAQRNAFGKTWYFAATGDEEAGWKLAYTADAKAAALTVTLKADGTTSIAGKLPNGVDGKGKAVAISVSASGYANVGGLREGVIVADFAPILTVNKVKTALAIKTNLWFDRKNNHENGVGEARFVR